MNAMRALAYVCFFVNSALACSPRVTLVPQQHGESLQEAQTKTDAERDFRYPKFELKGNLAKIFEITDCEYISGMTCRIHYNGSLPLPTQVFFMQFDERGRQSGARVRLIYPKLEPGETGRATFRIRIHPTKVVLEGEWKGPWKNPY